MANDVFVLSIDESGSARPFDVAAVRAALGVGGVGDADEATVRIGERHHSIYFSEFGISFSERDLTRALVERLFDVARRHDLVFQYPPVLPAGGMVAVSHEGARIARALMDEDPPIASDAGELWAILTGGLELARAYTRQIVGGPV